MKVGSTRVKELLKMILGDLSLYWEKSAYPWFQNQDHSNVVIKCVCVQKSSLLATIANISTLGLHMAYCNLTSFSLRIEWW